MSNLSIPQFYRLQDIVTCRKKGKIGLLPISRSTFLNMVASGKFPSAAKLGKRAVCWKKSDIDAILSKLEKDNCF